MSGFTEHQASNAGEDTDRQAVVLNLGSARRMLPLLRRIVGDVQAHQQRLDELGPEQDRLDRNRRTLDWPQRQRRYQIHEEFAAAENHLKDILAELEVLGVLLVDAHRGQLALPTVVNGRLAYFSWQPDESSVLYWHFPGEKIRRQIPSNWNEQGMAPLKAHG